jgi:EmrB/QacA subfamily drug resistance transporter
MKKTNRPLTVVALMLGLFMGAMEMTVVSTAMPTVIADLGGIEHYGWVFTAYMLATTVMVPIWGKLADVYGRKPIMVLGTTIFLVGSILSGQAHTMTWLIVFRALQGLGAGAMQPIALTIVGDIFDLKERAKMQGAFGAVWGVAGMIGPLLGGLIVHALSWRWVFYVNVPFGLASMALLVMNLHENVERRTTHRFDVLGAVLLSAAIVVPLLAGGVLGVLVGAVCLALFVWAEQRSSEPMLPISLLSRPLIAASSCAGFLIGGAMLCAVTFVPLFAQGVLGSTPTQAGAAIAPMAIGWPIASAISGRLLPRFGFRLMVRIGCAVACVATAFLSFLVHPHTSLGLVRVAMALFGVGLGFANTALVIGVQTSVSWQERGVATASTMFFRTIGGALAIGLFGRMLTNQLVASGGFDEKTANLLLSPERSHLLDASVIQGLAGTLNQALHSVFLAIVGLTAAAVVTSIFFPRLHPATAPADAPSNADSPPSDA